MDVFDIYEIMKEHFDLMHKTEDVLNYYTEEKIIIDNTNGLVLTRRLLIDEINKLNKTLTMANKQIESLSRELYKLTGWDVLKYEDNLYNRFDILEYKFEMVRQGLEKFNPIKECEDNE